MKKSMGVCCLGLVLVSTHCKPGGQNKSTSASKEGGGDDSTATSGTAFSKDVAHKLACDDTTGLKMYNTGDKPTRVYTWSFSQRAKVDPKAYIEGLVRSSLETNKTFDSPNWMGDGVYVASDPIQSADYGMSLIEFDIKKSNFPFAEDKDTAKKAYDKNCPGALYQWNSRYSIKGVMNGPKSEDYLWDGAVVLWDLALVDFDSIKVTPFTGKSPDDKDPLLKRVFTDLGTKQEKYLSKNMVSQISSGGESDGQIKEVLVQGTLSKCLTLDNFANLKNGSFLGSISYAYGIDVKYLSTIFSGGSKSDTIECLSILGSKLRKNAKAPDVIDAVKTLLPHGPAFTTWINGEVAFWKSVQENEMKLHRLADWLPAK